MSMRYLSLLLTLLLSLTVTAQQPVKRAKKRAKARTEQRADQRLDQQVDAGVDKAFGAIEGLFKKKKQRTDTTAPAGPTERVEDGGLRANDGEAYADEEEANQAVMNALGLGDGDWEPYTNPVTFSLTMQVTETKKNGRQESNAIRLGATETQFAMNMEDGQGQGSRMILNTQDGYTTTVATDKRGETQGFRMRMPNLGSLAAETMAEATDYITYTETDQRRTIDGYACTLVIVKDSKHGTTTESWVTQDLDLTALDVFGGMAGLAGAGKQATAGAPDLPAALQGFPIESTSTDGKTVTTTKMQNIQIGPDAVDRSLFDLNGVEIQELGF